MAHLRADTSKCSNTMPVPMPDAAASGVACVTLSASPPTRCTMGGVPYRWLIIWLSPHGSNADGMRKKSAPASTRWASASENVRATPTLSYVRSR